MPPSRRKSAQSRPSQQTLAFGPHANKVTKSSLAHLSTNKPSKPSPLSKEKPALEEPFTPSPTSIKGEEGEEIVKEEGALKIQEDALLSPGRLAIREAKPIVKKKSAVEERADKVGDGQVKKYWEAIERERKTKRVHQQDLTLHEKILRHFDLSSQYGPCIGISRLKRWNRAETLGLHPPIEVLAVLMREEAKVNEEKSVQIAYLDELLNTRMGVGM